VLAVFPNDTIAANWIRRARAHVPFEGLPARIAWLGHGARTALAVAVNPLVANGALVAPIAFPRDHLDAAAMAHPNIMTERMKAGSDAIADWPLLDAMAMCSSMADPVAIHSGGGYARYMTSAGVTIIADGSEAAAARLSRALPIEQLAGALGIVVAERFEFRLGEGRRGVERSERALTTAEEQAVQRSRFQPSARRLRAPGRGRKEPASCWGPNSSDRRTDSR